jgi:hypothetical protein
MTALGFTGTQRGMTFHQTLVISNYLLGQELVQVWAHHGDCLGADHDFHRLIRQLRHPIAPSRYVGRIHLHPPDVDTKRAFCDYDRIEIPEPYLKRNHDIVDACWLLIATPGESEEVLRSGTWATIRYAKKTGRLRWVINPDGTTNTEWSELGT